MAAAFTSRGVAIVAITLGAAGAYLAVSPDGTREDQFAIAFSPLCSVHSVATPLSDGCAGARMHHGSVLASASQLWVAGEDVHLPAAPTSKALNVNGAGDAFVAGVLAAILWPEALSLRDTLQLALASARQRIDLEVESRPVADLLSEFGQ